MKADAKTEKEVMAVWNKFLKAYAARDMDSILATISSDRFVVALGTGPDERRVGPDEMKAQIQRDWAQSEAATVETTWSLVSAAGSVAWIACQVIMKAKISGKKVNFPGRFSAVLQKQGDKWLLMQTHFSFIESGQAKGESFPAPQR